MLNVHLSEAMENLDKLIRQANEDNHPIEIICSEKDSGAVLISKKSWSEIQKTLYLQNSGVLSKVKQFEDEEVEELRDTLDDYLSHCEGQNPVDELFGEMVGKEEI